jgi:YHS domain-containing protein
VVLGLAGAAAASAGEYNTGYFGNVAIEGYDPVAYFIEGRARQGSPDITYDWQGVTWQFASAAHRDEFMRTPESYAPQFGGLCAEGVAYDEISANLDPEVFEIVDGKLYLNYSAAFVDLKTNLPIAQSKWDKVHDLLASK